MRLRPLFVLALFPGALALLVLVASPGKLAPGLPFYRFNALGGDAYGYYYCARAVLAKTAHRADLVLPALVVAVAVVAVAQRRSKRSSVRVVALSWACGVVAAALAAVVGFTGAPEFGWPLVWSVLLIPERLAGIASPHAAAVPAIALALVCNAATVLATYALARRCGFRERVAVAGAALVSLWPLLSLLTGSTAALNGTWQVWLGLSLYTEPLSTALITVALALCAAKRLSERDAAIAGVLLGLATLVRLSNVLIAGCVVVGLLVRGERRAAMVTSLAGLAWAPAVLIYYPNGYPKLKPPTYPAHPFALSYAAHAWSRSYLWHPSVLLVLVPIALLGAVRATRAAALLIGASVVVTAAFYTFYEETPIHPRFLYAVLPAVLVLWAAGAATIVDALKRRRLPHARSARVGAR